MILINDPSLQNAGPRPASIVFPDLPIDNFFYAGFLNLTMDMIRW